MVLQFSCGGMLNIILINMDEGKFMKKIYLKNFLFILLIFGESFALKINAFANTAENLEFKFSPDLTAQIVKISSAPHSDEIEGVKNEIRIPEMISKDGVCYKVTSFANDCEVNCENLEEVYFPETFIGSRETILNIIKFVNACPVLERIYVAPNCETLSGDLQGILYNKEQTFLIICPSGKKEAVEIPKSVKAIYLRAFDKCKKIPKSIKMPLNIKYIGNILCDENYKLFVREDDTEVESRPKHKKILIILLGESGAGKTTIAEYLKKYGYINIPTYTTRPPRFKGEEGHIFINIDSADNIVSLENSTDRKLIYITYFANNWYWAYEDQISDYARSVIAFNPTETKNFKEYVKDRKVIVIYIKTDRKECVNRMKKRALNVNLTNDELKHDIERRVILEDNEYSSFSCDYVIDATKGITQTIINLENCLYQEGLK